MLLGQTPSEALPQTRRSASPRLTLLRGVVGRESPVRTTQPTLLKDLHRNGTWTLKRAASGRSRLAEEAASERLPYTIATHRQNLTQNSRSRISSDLGASQSVRCPCNLDQLRRRGAIKESQASFHRFWTDYYARNHIGDPATCAAWIYEFSVVQANVADRRNSNVTL